MYLKAHAPSPEYTEALRQRQVSTFLVNERKWLKHGLIKSVWTGCVRNMEDLDGLLETMIFIADHTDQHPAPGWRLFRKTGTEKGSWRHGYEAVSDSLCSGEGPGGWRGGARRVKGRVAAAGYGDMLAHFESHRPDQSRMLWSEMTTPHSLAYTRLKCGIMK